MKKKAMETAIVKPSKESKVRASIITDEQAAKIHQATLKLLKDTGLRVGSIEAAKIFEENGAEVEYKDKYAFVKIPGYMVENAIQTAQKPMVYYGRIPEKDFTAYKNHVGFTDFGECVKVIDLETKEVRDSEKRDNGDLVKVCDYYDEIVVIDRPCVCTDYPSSVQPLHNLDIVMKSTSKSIFIGAANRENCKRMIDMAAVAVGGMDKLKARPFLNIFVCPTSPLEMAKECCEITIDCAKAGIGIAIIPMLLAGATGPVTMGGAIVNHNAEVLSCVILSQLVKKGARATYCSMSTLMDLKHAQGSCGAPEQGIISAGVTKMAQLYNLPSWAGSGLSDSKLPDAQTGYEFATNAMTLAFAGTNMIMGAGSLESGLTMDFAKLVMDCEAMSYIRKLISGVEVTEDTMALEVTDKVGPTGAYLSQKHTFVNMKQQSQVEIFDRKTRHAWETAGAKSAADTAYEKAAWILENHQVAPLVPGAEEKIAEMIKQYETEILGAPIK